MLDEESRTAGRRGRGPRAIRPQRGREVFRTTECLCGEQHRQDCCVGMADRVDADSADHRCDRAVGFCLHPGRPVLKAQMRQTGQQHASRCRAIAFGQGRRRLRRWVQHQQRGRLMVGEIARPDGGFADDRALGQAPGRRCPARAPPAVPRERRIPLWCRAIRAAMPPGPQPSTVAPTLWSNRASGRKSQSLSGHHENGREPLRSARPAPLSISPSATLDSANRRYAGGSIRSACGSVATLASGHGQPAATNTETKLGRNSIWGAAQIARRPERAEFSRNQLAIRCLALEVASA